MYVNLDKIDLLSLVMGTDPPYSIVNHLTDNELGILWGGHNEEWQWNKHSLKRLTEEELLSLYKSVREAKEKSTTFYEDAEDES